jgi:ribosome-binding ATPase YchF (GTP1/OBG family)
VVPDTIEFHDIAGLVAGAHKGEGLGNQFLANIRETDALLHVVRAHDDPNVIHPDGRVDPAADMDTIETELIYADLEQAERRHARIVREARSGDRRAVGRGEVAAGGDRGAAVRAAGALGAGAGGRAARGARPRRADRQAGALRANVSEGEDEVPAVVTEHAAGRDAAAVAISSRLEAELSELDDDEAGTMREELGISESGLQRVVGGAFSLLNLIAFFTAGEDKPAQSWHLRRGCRPGTRRVRSTPTSSAASSARR